MGEDKGTADVGNVIRIDEERIKDHLGKIVRGTVEDTLNALLDAEADRLCRATRYERTDARQDTRAGSYRRKLHTRAGEVTLKVPKRCAGRRSRRRSSSATAGGRPRSRRP
jgi:putative transposase